MRAITAVAILTLLITGVSFTDAQDVIPRADRKKMRETRESMRELALSLRTLQQMEGAYPKTLQAIVDNDLEEALPKDGWGNDFIYAISDEHEYQLTSRGSDGEIGGVGGARDIVWTPAGELRELTPEEEEEAKLRLAEQTYQAKRVIAKAKMVVVGSELLNARRSDDEWPENLDAIKPTGESIEDKRKLDCFADPWGYAFEMRVLPHENFAVICRGEDGEEGGQGRNADFVITEREVRASYRRTNTDSWRWGVLDNDWQVTDLVRSVNEYKQRHGKLPKELQDLVRGGAGQAIRGGIPNDIWGNDYAYVVLGEDEFYIVGLGKDEIAGGVKDNKDVIRPEPGTTPEEAWDGGMVGPAVVPEIDDNEVLIEVADELMLDIADKLNAWHAENGEYPESLDDIKEQFPGEETPLDPWENAFQYTRTEDADGNVTGFKITCLGSDGTDGGDGTAADFSFDQDLSRSFKAGAEGAEERTFR